MSIASYTLKIKELNDCFGSINVNIDNDDRVKYALEAEHPGSVQ